MHYKFAIMFATCLGIIFRINKTPLLTESV